MTWIGFRRRKQAFIDADEAEAEEELAEVWDNKSATIAEDQDIVPAISLT